MTNFDLVEKFTYDVQSVWHHVPQIGGTGALGASIASMAKLTNPVLCVDPSREMLEVVDWTKD